MKLESVATAGRDALKLEPLIQNDVVETTGLVYEVFKHRNKFSVADLAFSAQSYLARSLAQLAVQKAKHLGVNVIGFSGGVAYNEHMTSVMRRVVEENGLRLVVHELVPPGDGGVSLGQAVAAAWQTEN
jgi:hydrogenase maturation protein HypF